MITLWNLYHPETVVFSSVVGKLGLAVATRDVPQGSRSHKSQCINECSGFSTVI